MAEFEGVASGEGRRVAVLVSRFNDGVTGRLERGAVDALLRAGMRDSDIDIVRVPGAWELPAAARAAAATERYDGIVALGAVIRGETPHFDYVAGAAADGLAAASVDYDLPIGFGVLTCDTLSQAESRSGGAHGNKGADAAMATLEMIDLMARLDWEPGNSGSAGDGRGKSRR